MKSGKVYYRDIFSGTLTKDVDACFGVSEAEVVRMLACFPAKAEKVRVMISASQLSSEAKRQYLLRFNDRLKAIAQ